MKNLKKKHGKNKKKTATKLAGKLACLIKLIDVFIHAGGLLIFIGLRIKMISMFCWEIPIRAPFCFTVNGDE